MSQYMISTVIVACVIAVILGVLRVQTIRGIMRSVFYTVGVVAVMALFLLSMFLAVESVHSILYGDLFK